MQNITLIVPTYNEASRWPHEYWNSLLSIDSIRWIFVNDGSSDGTKDLLSNLTNPMNYEVINVKENKGKAEALRNGFQHYFSNHFVDERQLVGFIDADDAFRRDDLLRVCEIARSKQSKFIEGTTPEGVVSTQAVWASRIALSGRNIERKRFRHYLGRLVAHFLNLKIERLPYDSQCGFKIFSSTKDLEDAMVTPFQTRWFVDIEILLRLRRQRDFIPWEEPLESWIDIPGSHLTFRETIRIANDIRKLLTINSSKPTKLD